MDSAAQPLHGAEAHAWIRGLIVSKFNVGDLVVLKSGSMRMCVEEIGENDTFHTVWCNEGIIGRDVFNVALLNKWEFREDSGSRGGDRGGPRGGQGGGKPYGGDRDGGGKPFRGGDRGDRGGRDRDSDGPPRKQGWDGKPRDKKFYRKDD
ncbi:MAG: hypothetical protein AB8B85_01770 [Paracoccaceae bacterium]